MRVCVVREEQPLRQSGLSEICAVRPPSLARSVRRHSRSGGGEESEEERDKEKKSKETNIILVKLAYVTHSDKERSVCW